MPVRLRRLKAVQLTPTGADFAREVQSLRLRGLTFELSGGQRWDGRPARCNDNLRRRAGLTTRRWTSA
jgi:hypothetical protein